MMKRWVMALLLTVFILPLVSAQQGTFTVPAESGRVFALSTAGGTLQLAELSYGFSGTIDVDYNPVDPRRWARVDNFGILRFVDPNGGQITEGVYTDPPFFDGFQADSPAGNKYFVRQVAWSPDGRTLAFRSENAAQPDLDQGLWYWAGVFQLSTDPAYQLLRPCPGFCSAAGVAGDYPGWDAFDFAWSTDNRTLLVNTLAYEYGGRRALMLRNAERVDPPPATRAPSFLLYDYGHWATDGQRIVVSGTLPDGRVGFGVVDRNGNGSLTEAAAIGMVWVQDAVQRPDGSLVMLASAVGASAPLQLVTETGDALTEPIGNGAPQSVAWNPDKSAVLVRTANRAFVAQVDGTITEISAVIANSPNVSWINGAPPTEWTRIPLPEPLTVGTPVPETIEAAPTSALPPTTEAQTTTLNVGDLLLVASGTLTIYAEPSEDAPQLATLQTGRELIVTSEPLSGAGVTWYRVQTLEHSGWIRDISGLQPVEP